MLEYKRATGILKLVQSLSESINSKLIMSNFKEEISVENNEIKDVVSDLKIYV